MDGGLRILIDGAKTDESEKTSAAPVEPKTDASPAKSATSSGTLHWIVLPALLGADLALLAWTARYALTHPLGPGGMLICAASVAVAAACGIAAAAILARGE